jgi:hypothetical protein
MIWWDEYCESLQVLWSRRLFCRLRRLMCGRSLTFRDASLNPSGYARFSGAQPREFDGSLIGKA